MSLVSDIKLLRTDTTLDLSQKAEKGINRWPNPHCLYTTPTNAFRHSLWDQTNSALLAPVFFLSCSFVPSLGCSPVFSFAFCALLFATWTPTCNLFRLPDSACPRAATPSSLTVFSRLSNLDRRYPCHPQAIAVACVLRINLSSTTRLLQLEFLSAGFFSFRCRNFFALIH